MRTPISYYGGKQLLIPEILPMIPKHTLYCEPFCGGASVFFQKHPSYIEVLNDTSAQVINFYSVCKDATLYPLLADLVNKTLYSSKQYLEAQKVLKSAPKEAVLQTAVNVAELSREAQYHRVRWAWAFWFVANFSFNHNMSSFGYGINYNSPTVMMTNKKGQFVRQDIADPAKTITVWDLCKRFEGDCYIECEDAVKVIKRWDKGIPTKANQENNKYSNHGSFFYCDPPYFNSDCGMYKGYTQSDFEALLEALGNIKGKFLLSCYPSEILAQYTAKYGWQQREIEMNINANILNALKGYTEKKKKVEVLTWNYSLDTGTLF